MTAGGCRPTVWVSGQSWFQEVVRMPVYEFKCGNCGELFEVMGSYAEREKEHPCPKCQSTDVKQAISLFSAKPPSSW